MAAQTKPSIKKGETIHDQESWSWTEAGYEILAQVRRDDDHRSDEFEEGCCYDLNDPKYGEQNRAIKDALDNGGWYYYGVTVAIRRCDVLLSEDSLWGIEGNFDYKGREGEIDNTHFNEIIQEVADEAKYHAREKLFALQASLLNVDPPAKLLPMDTSETPTA